MKVGLGSYAYRWAIGFKDWQPDTPLQPIGLVDKAAQHGFDLLQIADNMPLQSLSEGNLETLLSYAQSKTVDLELGTDGIMNGNAETYLAIAEKLDAKLVRATLSHEDLKEPRANLISALKKVAQAYGDAGVTLALENHFLLSSEALVNILESVNQQSLGICLDVANSIASKEWPETTIEQLAPFTVNLHLKDYRFEIDPYGVGFRAVGVPLGEGELDIQNVFDTLQRENKRVNVVLEHWLPKEQIEQEGLEAEDLWTGKSLEAARAYVDTFKQEGT